MQPIRAASPIRIAHADGRDEAITFRTIAEQSSRYAHWLSEMGVAHGDRVAIMLEPSLAFYAALFGTMKLGAIAVPLFTLFGPDGVRLAARRLFAAPVADNVRQGAIARHAIDTDHRAGRCLRRVRVAISDDLRAGNAPRRSGDLPVHVRHNARAACRNPPHPSCHRGGHDRGALWHGHSPGRPVLLSVIAGLGSWALARHAGAAGAWRRDRRLCRPLRCGTSVACVAGFRHHQSIGRGDALPHDAHVWRGVALPLRAAQAVVHRRADRQRQPGVRRTHLRRPPVQHVWHDRGWCDPRQLPRCRGFRRQDRRAWHAGAWRQGGGATTGR